MNSIYHKKANNTPMIDKFSNHPLWLKIINRNAQINDWTAKRKYEFLLSIIFLILVLEFITLSLLLTHIILHNHPIEIVLPYTIITFILLLSYFVIRFSSYKFAIDFFISICYLLLFVTIFIVGPRKEFIYAPVLIILIVSIFKSTKTVVLISFLLFIILISILVNNKSLTIEEILTGPLEVFVIAILIVISNSDLTKKIEQHNKLELIRRERRFRNIFNVAPIGIYVCSIDGQFIQNNAQFRDMIGYTSDELKSMKYSDITPEDDLEDNLNSITDLIDGNYDSIRLQRRYVRKDKKIIWVNVTIAKLDDEITNNQYLMATIEDITEKLDTERCLQKNQAQLIQTQKMESLGRLAGGLAHDFNNLLTAIDGYSDLLLISDIKEQPLLVEEIQKACNHAASITRQLLTFSKKEISQPAIINLNEILQDMTNMLNYLVSNNIKLETTLDPELNNVRIDRNQIQQVIMNLIINAKESITGEGTIEIQTNNCQHSISLQSHHSIKFTRGDCVILTIKDTGSGISSDILPNIFDPFFTTKEKGTGLGKSLSHYF